MQARNRTNAILGALLVLTVAAGGPSMAHDWYIQAVDYVLPRPGVATIFQGWGHKVPVDGTLAAEKIAKLELLRPDGTRSALAIDPGKGLHVISLDLEAPGVYTVAGESTPGYYHIYRDGSGQTHHSTRALDEIEDAAQVFFSCRAFQNPKTHIVVGDPGDCAAPGPTNAPLEIVLDQPAGTLRAGDRATFRILADGEPAPDEATYDITYMGYSSVPEEYLYMKRRPVEGRGQFDIPCAGVWYIRVHLLKPAPEELRSKCRDLLYNATLTLEAGEKLRGQGRVTEDD